MSRLRRLVLSDRYFFVTCRLLPPRRLLRDSELECHARVVSERRTEHGFLLTAWVSRPLARHFLPGLSPDHCAGNEVHQGQLHIPHQRRQARKRKVVATALPFDKLRAGFDRALRTVKEYHEKVDYIHQNPARAGLVKRAEDWNWSSMREYSGTVGAPSNAHRILRIDRVVLPADERARI